MYGVCLQAKLLETVAVIHALQTREWHALQTQVCTWGQTQKSLVLSGLINT